MELLQSYVKWWIFDIYEGQNIFHRWVYGYGGGGGGGGKVG